MPVVAFIRDGSADGSARFVAAFRKGLNETGYVEGQNVTIEYHWLEGHFDRVPALVADLVRRLFVVGDTFFTSRAVQFATLTSRDRIPAAYAVRELVEAGGLMSYGTDLAAAFRQVGVYTGSILKGAKQIERASCR